MIESYHKKGNRLDDVDKEIIRILASYQYSGRYISIIVGCSERSVYLWRQKLGLAGDYPHRQDWRAYNTIMSKVLGSV